MSWIFGFTDIGSTILNRATPLGPAPSVVRIPKTVLEISSGISDTTGVFYNRPTITSIIVPSTLQKIGRGAFNGCIRLSSIIGLSSLNTIEQSVFFGCSSLKAFSSIGILNTIGQSTFFNSGVSSLSLQFNSTLQTISSNVFSGARQLSTLVINDNPPNVLPSSISSIGTYAFSNCSSIKYLSIQGNLTSIGSYAFSESGISSLSLQFNSTLQTIPSSAFRNAGQLLTLVINDNPPNVLPSSISSIETYAFQNCSSIKYLSTQGALTSIGTYAFENSGVSSLSLYFNSTLQTIQSYAFIRARQLSTLVINNNPPNILPSSISSIGTYAFGNCSSIMYLSTQGALTSIGQYAFSNSGVSSLSLRFNSTLQTIPLYAFSGASQLSTLVINDNPPNVLPSSISSIETYAFYNCSSISYLSTQGALTSIGSYAFYNSGVSSLSLRFNSTLQTIQSYTFYGIRQLSTLVINDNSPNVLPSSISGIGTYAFYNCSAISYLLIQGVLTSIGQYAFSNLVISSLSLRFNSTLQTIPSAAFSGARHLSTLVINDNPPNVLPSSISSIGNYAFYNCSSISYLSTQGNLTSIGLYAFLNSGVSSLSLQFNSTLQTIQSYTFYGIRQLSTLVINDNPPNVLPSSISSIGASAFENCSSIMYLSTQGALTGIGASAFLNSGVSSLSLRFNSTLQTISNYAFSGARQLSTLVINDNPPNVLPSSISSIATYAFDRCSSISYLSTQGALTSIGIYAFENSGVSSLSLQFNSTLQIIPNYAFIRAQQLSTLVINDNPPNVLPSSISSIGNYAFYNCSSISYLSTQGNLTSIGLYAFLNSGVSSLSLQFNSTLQTIPQFAFFGARQLSTLVINDNPPNVLPSSISSIGASAFENCSSIMYLSTQGALTSIGEYAFYNSGISSLSLRFNSTLQTIPNYAFSGAKQLSILVINNNPPNVLPSSISSIETYAFSNCSSIKYLSTEGQLTSIGVRAFEFSGVSAMSLQISTTFSILNAYTFVNCRNLSTIIFNNVINTIPSSITTIQISTFSGCSSITNIYMHKGISTIWPGAFDGCSTMAANFGNDLIENNPSKIESIIVHNSFFNPSNVAISPISYLETGQKQRLLSYASNLNTNSYATTLISTNRIKVNSFSSSHLDNLNTNLMVLSQISSSSSIITLEATKHLVTHERVSTIIASDKYVPEIYDTVLLTLDKRFNSPMTIVYKDDMNTEKIIGTFDINRSYEIAGPGIYIFNTVTLNDQVKIALEGMTNKEFFIRYTGPFSETTFIQALPPVELITSLNCTAPPYNATNFTAANSVILSTLITYANTQPQYPLPTGSNAQQISLSKQNITYFNAVNQDTIAIRNSVAPLSGKQYPQFKTQTERLMYLQGMTLTAARNQITGQNPSGPAGVPCSTIYQIINS